MPYSVKRHLAIGTLLGAGVGVAFALALISVADCAGAGCTWERINAVIGHAVLGSFAGAVVGAIAFLVRKALHGK